MEHENSQRKKEASGKIVKYILITGLIAGTLDISAAIINYMIATGGKNPVIILYFISSGVFGQFAFSGGLFYAVCGVVFHFVIAYSFISFYFFVYPRTRKLLKNRYLCGAAFGIATWCVMNLVVVPLSKTPPTGFSLRQFILSILFLILFIGLPAAISAEKFYSE